MTIMIDMENGDLCFLTGGHRSPAAPRQINVNNEIGSAILAFSTTESATFYKDNYIYKDNYDLSMLVDIPDEHLSKALLVFNSEDEIRKAYTRNIEYDFSVHLRPWPDKKHGTKQA
jgi:hypothetical protein